MVRAAVEQGSEGFGRRIVWEAVPGLTRFARIVYRLGRWRRRSGDCKRRGHYRRMIELGR